jgi:hypothetical protein
LLSQRKDTPDVFSIQESRPGVEIRGHPVVRDHHFLGKDDHVLTDGSPSDDLIFAFIIVLCEEGPQIFLFRDGSPSGNHEILVKHQPGSPNVDPSITQGGSGGVVEITVTVPY